MRLRLENGLKRFAMILGAVAFLWACGATVYVLLASSEAGIAASSMIAASGDTAKRMPPPLATANGVWMTGLLIGVTLLAGIPMGIAMAHPAGQRRTAWMAGLLLLGFCLISGFFVGLLYLPSTILLIAAGAADKVEPRGSPLLG